MDWSGSESKESTLTFYGRWSFHHHSHTSLLTSHWWVFCRQGHYTRTDTPDTPIPDTRRVVIHGTQSVTVTGRNVHYFSSPEFTCLFFGSVDLRLTSFPASQMTPFHRNWFPRRGQRTLSREPSLLSLVVDLRRREGSLLSLNNRSLYYRTLFFKVFVCIQRFPKTMFHWFYPLYYP